MIRVGVSVLFAQAERERSAGPFDAGAERRECRPSSTPGPHPNRSEYLKFEDEATCNF